MRQRLTLRSGYAIAEVPLRDDSELAHKSLRDAKLRERDVQVISIHRGALTIPNPRGEREMLPGDVLLCYGKAITLRGLIPHRAPTKRPKRTT